MPENQEKKILIDVKILDNFITAKKNADEARKALNDYIKSGEINEKLQRELAQSVAKTNNEFKEAKTQLEAASKSQDMFATAGNKANKTLGEMQRELKALKNTPLDFGDPAQVREVEQAMADLKAQIEDYNVKIKGLDTGEVWNNMASGIEVVVAGASGLSNGLKAIGIESPVLEQLQNSTTELIATVQAMAVVTEYLDQRKLSLLKTNIATLYSENNLKLAKLLGINVTAAQTAAEEAAIVIKGRSSIASKGAAVAQWLWNSAILANPLVAIIVVILSAIAAVYLLTKSFDTSAAAQETARKTNIAYEQQVQKTQNTIDAIEAKRTKQVNDAELAGRKELDSMKRNGATKEQIAAKEVEIATTVRNINIKTSADIVKAKLSEIRASDLTLKVHLALLPTLKKGSEEYNKQVEAINELMKKKKEAAGVLNTEVANGKKLTQEQQEAQTAIVEAQTQKRKDIAQRNAKAEMDLITVKQNAIIKGLNDTANDEKKNFDQRLTAASNSETEQIKLLERTAEFEKKQKGITAKEILLIDEKLKQDKIKVTADTEKTKTDIETKQLDKRLKDAADNLEKQKQLLSEKQQNDLIELSKTFANNASKAKNDQEYTALKNKYEKDKFDVAQKYREKEFSDSATAMQALIDSLPKDAKARIDIEKAVADAKAKYAEESAAIVIKTNEDIVDSGRKTKDELEALDEQLKAKKEELYGQLQTTLQDIAGGIFASQAQKLDEETQAVTDSQQTQIAAVEAKEKAGTISKANAEKEKERITLAAKVKTDALEKEKRKQAREQAIVERAFAVFSIGLSTTKAAMAALSAPPIGLGPIAGIPLAIATGAIGALQLASVMVAPLPKASRGLLLHGPSHASGGIPIEAEGGEAIINKKSTAKYMGLLSAINVAGGGVPFARFQDGGYLARQSMGGNSITRDDIKDAMKDAVKGIKVYATVEDIQKADKNYMAIEDRANY